MFVRMAIDQTVSLHDVDDLRRLHVEIAGLDDRALQSALRRHDLGRTAGRDELDLRVDALRRLAGDRDDQWAVEFADMLAYADSKGWMVDGYVRAHCVRIPATSTDPVAVES